MKRKASPFPDQSETEQTSVLVLDCETTGLGATSRIVEIGLAMLSSTGELLGTWSSLLCGDRWIDEGASSVNGITNEMLRDAPKFKSIAGPLASLMESTIVVAHNAKFDHGRLAYEYVRLREEPPGDFVCSMSLLSQFGYGRLSLQRATELFGVDIGPDHSAERDALATAKLLQILSRRHVNEWSLW